jgi:hypothetical protein
MNVFCQTGDFAANSIHNRTRLITAGLMLGLLLVSLDQTIVTTAMPTIVRKLGGLSLYS